MVQVPLKDYVYSNARVRAMASRLLEKGTFDELLAAADFGRAVNILDNTEYGPDIEVTILEGFRPTSIDRALNRNLARNFSKVKEFFIGRPQELLKVLLSRWDLYNLKTIIRGKRAMVPKAEISRNLMPVGSLDLVVLDLIIDQPDLRAALDAIVMFSSQWWINYGEAIAPHMAEFLREKDLSIIELALDRFHWWGWR
jgi:V/A-type H+-transporting ATPase subunit C